MSPNRLSLSLAVAFAGAALAGPAAAKTCPNIMFVLDQSSSMADDPNGGKTHPSKFELLTQAVLGLVNQYGDRVPFGLQLFQSDAFKDDAKCYNDTKIDVEPAGPMEDRSLRSNDVITLLKAAMPVPGSRTNTGEAIKRATEDMILHDAARNNFLILVTDGEPSCNRKDLETLSAPDGSSEWTIDQINIARNAKILTFVVGFDGEMGVNKRNLDEMAYSGGASPKNCDGKNIHCYYSASDAATLQTALGKVIDQIAGGEFGSVLCDDSCYSNGCPDGQVCRKSELDPAPRCVPDPCMGMTCNKDQFCRLGKCVGACKDGCKANEKCIDGGCQKDPCAGKECPDGEICCPLGVSGCAAGSCVPDYCRDKTCVPPSICENGSGKCVDDQCKIVTCPPGTTCKAGGNCSGSASDRGKGGCSLTTRVDPDSVAGCALVLLALFGLARALRRRSRSAPL
ncbi:MAG: VWA domain-containing protein [Myxococcales bacterium]|nr:VWA domain-containing protein [Myxococcales bacterium]